jgi:hypothetical protein
MPRIGKAKALTQRTQRADRKKKDKRRTGR